MGKTIEHIVLIKVKPNTEPTKITQMVQGLNSLITIPHVLQLSAGPIHNSSSSFHFTHILHSRYKSKQDLDNYMASSTHKNFLVTSLDPILDDILLLDWVVYPEVALDHPSPGEGMRVSFCKLKKGLGEKEKEEALKVCGGFKGSSVQFTCGENFSAESKGFDVASIAVFSGVEELDLSVWGVEEEKEKVKGFVERFEVVDYVVSLGNPSRSFSFCERVYNLLFGWLWKRRSTKKAPSVIP